MELERNARICRNCLPFWAIPYTIYTYYLSLFLMEKGLTSADVARLMSIANASALVFSFVASPVVDRMGRRLSTFIFDIASAVLPCLLYIASGSFITAAIAQAMTGLNRIMSTGYYLLMIEDTSDRNSMNAMNWFNIILVGAGLTTPIAGIVVSRLGIVKGEMLFLLLSALLMLTQAIVRHVLVSETPTGRKIMAQKTHEASNPLRAYLDATRYMFQSRRVLSAMVVNALIYVYYTIGTTISMFFAPYFSTFRNLGSLAVGLIGGIYAAGTLLSMILINPRIKPEHLYQYTIASSLVSILGFVLMILCPMGNTVLVFVSIALISISYGSLKTIADSVLALEMNSVHSSSLYSLSFIFSSVFSIVAIQILQVLYSKSPNWLFGTSAVLIFLVLLDALVFLKSGESKS